MLPAAEGFRTEGNHFMLAGHPTASEALFDLIAAAERLVLAGHPRPAATSLPGSSTVARPKEILLELVRAGLPAEGGPELLAGANPHFLRMADWSPALAVLHGAALELACPVPLARNLFLLDGEDLLALAEEHRTGDPLTLRRQRVGLMDGVLTPGTLPVPEALVPAPHRPLPLAALLQARGRLPRADAGPVGWCGCDFETGPYNFLGRRRQPRLGTSRVPVLMQAARRTGRPTLVAFATPGTLPELGPALRACAALPIPLAGATPAPLLHVFFFGSPEELVSSLEQRPGAGLFGDKLESPRIRFLFGPFAAAELLEVVEGAAGSVDTCHGGVLDALAQGLGVPNRIILGADGRFDAWHGPEQRVRGVDWDAIHAPAMLARRHHKADRSRERQLLALLAGML